MQLTADRASALAALDTFLPRAGRVYADTRNYDDGGSRTNVSRLSPWLHAGLLSEAEVCERVLAEHSSTAAEKFIAEVFWRIYFKGYLAHRPTIWASYREERDAAWERLETNSGVRTAYTQAIEGRTGIAAFDHWAKELIETGYLHNHARMWFASIWIFTLKLDWQLGADFFLRHLLDADAASNTLSWRWVGGLHTKGKTYLARRDNIARYTANHPDGPLAAEGLAEEAAPLTETRDHARQPLELPPSLSTESLPPRFALLLHDEAASHAALDLPVAPSLVIGAARPDARSPRQSAAGARQFAIAAVEHGVATAAADIGCGSAIWSPNAPLAALLADAKIDQVLVPFLPTGWTRDALWPELAPLAAGGALIQLLPELDRATWPHAKAGFFGVKKQIDRVLGEVGIGGGG